MLEGLEVETVVVSGNEVTLIFLSQKFILNKCDLGCFLVPNLFLILTKTKVTLTCHLECSPLCGVEWLVDGMPLEDGLILEEEEVEHNITEEVIDEDEEADQFSSIVSTLTWHQLKNIEDDFNITCR